MKVLLKTKGKGVQTLVDTDTDPHFPSGYVNLDGSPLEKVTVRPAPRGAIETAQSIDEWLALKKIGYRKLNGDQRKRYKELKALHG